MKVRKLVGTVLAMYLAAVSHSASAQSLPDVTDAMNNIFALAESKLGAFFPTGSQTQFFQDYVYRYYQATDTYLAFADGSVLIVGGAFGSSIVNAGTILSVESLLESYQIPEGTGELWNLGISGTVVFFGQSTDFSDINLDGVAAPDITNTDALAEFMNSNLEDLPVDGSSLSVVVVANTDSQRIVDVSFTLNVDGLTASYELRLTFTR